LKDPWQARNEYIRVILDRSANNLSAFCAQHATRQLEPADEVKALKLLEMQRHLMLMYTSCGWFFDELSGIETVQVLHYAGRAVQLATEVFQDATLEPSFLAKLAEAKSNIAEHQEGARIYEKFVKPAIVDIPRLAAHYAIRSVFEEIPEHAGIYSYSADRAEYTRSEAGKMKLVTGQAQFTSRITEESARLCFGVLHLGDHHVSAGVREFTGVDEYSKISEQLHAAFARADAAEVLGLMNHDFENNIYSLKSLFRDDQRKILDIILQSNIAEAESSILRQYEQEAPLMRFLADLHVEQPKLFKMLAEFALNSRLREALQQDHVNAERVQALLHEASAMKIDLDTATLEFVVRRQTERKARAFWNNPKDNTELEELEAAVNLARSLPFDVNLWQVQNLSALRLNGTFHEMRTEADRGDEYATNWVRHMTSLAENLDLRLAA
jgi:hypothetical protein